MSAALFQAKFTVPEVVPTYRVRARLDRAWAGWPRVRLVTVCAGAGWGKTSFAARRARRLGPTAVWYTLDELDRDPSVMASHLVAALGLPPSDGPAIEQLAGIVGSLARRRMLVLDDLHAIADAPEARSYLGRLLRYLDPACQLVLLTREHVSLRAANLQTRGEAVDLAAGDLAFTADECRRLLRARLGRSASEPIACRVHELTEGWPAGLEIVCRTLGQTDLAAHGEVLERLTTPGSWFDRFVADILDDLAPEVRDILLRTAWLPELTPALCEQLLGRRDGFAGVSRLNGTGLPVVSLGDGHWRYHNLLRRNLRERSRHELSPSVWRRTVRRAARLLARAGEPEAALLELIRAGDHPAAATLAERHRKPLLVSRRPRTLAHALDLMPERELRSAPALLLVRAASAQLRGHWTQAESDLRRVRRLAPGSAHAGGALARLVRLHLQRGHWETCLRSGRRALATRAPLAAADRGEVLAAMGVAAASLGRLDAGAAHLRQARALAGRRRDRALVARCDYLLAANVLQVRGALDEALVAARRAQAVAAELDHGELACHAEGVVGYVLAALGRESEARATLDRARQRAEAIGYRLIAGYTRYTLGECDLLASDPAAACENFAIARQTAQTLGEEALLNLVWLGLAEAFRRLDDRAEALAAAGRALALAERRGDRLFCGRALALQARIIAERDRAAAVAGFRRAERVLGRLGAELELARVRIWRAELSGPGQVQRVCSAVAAGPCAGVVAQLGHATDTLAGPPGRQRAATVRDNGLRIRVLGSVEIDRDGAPLLRGAWRSRRARGLFNVLASARFAPVPREQTMEVLWPDADPARAANSLRQSVFQLRRLLASPGPDGPEVLRTDGEVVQLVLDGPQACDRLVFEDAIAAGRRARRDGDHQAELEHLLRACDQWRGPFLADTPYEAAAQEAGVMLHQAFRAAVERAAALLGQHGRFEEMLELARRGAREDPLHEPFAMQQLRALLSLGRPAEARETHERFTARYQQELGLLPPDELRDLADQAQQAAG
jgi:ATP/maltotriose-dependent transcriptional regulator MalT/DNA-binding SARP family transcriptional activator